MKLVLELDPREPQQMSEGQSLLKHTDYWLALWKLSNAFSDGQLPVEQFNEILEEHGITLEEIR